MTRPVVRGHARTGRPRRYEFSTAALRFESGDGRCRGRLYKPDRPTDPATVVMAPGVGLTWRESLAATAERLAERGYAAFVYDHRGFGVDADPDDGVVSPARQRADLDAAVDELAAVDDVDGDRLALWGMDLSAGTALAAAADGPGVRAVVARFPVVDGASLLPGWVRPRLGVLGAGLTDRVLSLAGRERSLPLFGSPDDRALVTREGAVRGVRRLGDEAADRRTPARSVLSLWRHDVGDSLADLAVPALFVAGTNDDVAPAETVETMSEEPRNASFVRVPAGHYDGLADGRTDPMLNHELAFLDSVL